MPHDSCLARRNKTYFITFELRLSRFLCTFSRRFLEREIYKCRHGSFLFHSYDETQHRIGFAFYYELESLLFYIILLHNKTSAHPRSLLEFSQNVRLAEQKCFLVAQLDLGSTVFGQENLVSGCQCGGVHGSGDIHLSGANSNDLTLVGVLGRIGGENNAAGSRDLLGSTLDQDTVGEGLEFAEDGL